MTIEFDLTPLGTKPAGVIGYADSSQSITGYDSFGMLIELGTNQCFRVRNGTTYAAARTVNFSPNRTYHLRIIANTSNRTYDVYVTPPGGSATLIASGYRFRNQSMNDVGKVALLQASGYGNFRINNHKVSRSGSIPQVHQLPRLLSSSGSSGSSVLQVPQLRLFNPLYSATNYSAVRSLGTSNTGKVTIEFDLTTVGNKPAGVIGYADSSQSITGYDSFGMVIELSTSGYFRVRNGSTYAAARTVNFSPNKTYHFRIIANTSNRSYDVYVTPPGEVPPLLPVVIASGISP